MSRLHELGQQVAALQDADLAALGAAEQAGEGFIRALRQQSRRAPARRRPAAYLLVAALLGVLAIAVVGWVSLATWISSRPLAVIPAVPLGDTIRAPLEGPIPLRFSDGSQVKLDAGTEAIIRDLTADGATVELGRGSARVSVTHRPSTRWLLRAGLYEIRVTGTRFDLAWDPDAQRLSLELLEGSVRVSSEGSKHSAIEMLGPERLVIDTKGWHLSRPEDDTVTAPERSAAPAAVASVATAAPTAGASVRPSAVSTLAAPGEGWEKLAGRGDYQAAYQAAQTQGLGPLAQTASAPQLIALAETCRLSGHRSEGAAVLSRLRSRFPGTEEAALAAFQLGRLTGGPHWFRMYLNERPNGTLAREASGRLIEALQRSGAQAEARAEARRYIATYPSGPHAAVAARILDD